MKRLRKRVGKLRFFACGEYGDATLRPHYHILLFGYDFSDRKPWRKSPSGHVLYRSAKLEALWPLGNCEVGALTPDSAGYVARYCLKKINGKQASEHYRRIHPLTGEVVQVRPEFICMSTKPGIGAEWYDKYSGDAFPSDFVVVDGKKKPVPRYYAKKLAVTAPEELERIKLRRIGNARRNKPNNTPERLAVREEVMRARTANLKRDLE